AQFGGHQRVAAVGVVLDWPRRGAGERVADVGRRERTLIERDQRLDLQQTRVRPVVAAVDSTAARTRVLGRFGGHVQLVVLRAGAHQARVTDDGALSLRGLPEVEGVLVGLEFELVEVALRRRERVRHGVGGDLHRLRKLVAGRGDRPLGTGQLRGRLVSRVLALRAVLGDLAGDGQLVACRDVGALLTGVDEDALAGTRVAVRFGVL